MTRADARYIAEICRDAGRWPSIEPNLVLALLDEALHANDRRLHDQPSSESPPRVEASRHQTLHAQGVRRNDRRQRQATGS